MERLSRVGQFFNFRFSLAVGLILSIGLVPNRLWGQTEVHTAPALKATTGSSFFPLPLNNSPPKGTAQSTTDSQLIESVNALDQANIPDTDIAQYEKGTLATEEEADENVAEDGAEDAEEEEVSEEEETLLGPRWHQIGPVTMECRYGGEFFSKKKGGLTNRSATRYRGCLDLMFTLDTQAAGWWSGGKFWAYAFETHGKTLSEQFVGDSQWYSSNDTGSQQSFTQLGEYWYQHSFWDQRLSVTLGRQDLSWNFGFADLAGDFINSSFITLGNIPMPTWPYQTLGASTFFEVSPKWKIGGGVFDQGVDRGIWTTTNTNRGMFSIGQVDYQPISADDGGLLTILRLGSWYSSSNPEAIDGSGALDNNYGFFGTVDRMLWAEFLDPSQGLGTFLMASWAPSDRNQVDWNYGTGFVYRGLLPGRDQDTLGLGLTIFNFSYELTNSTGATSEDATEVFYKAKLRRGITIQPDLQYIARPSGVLKDALLAGVRVEVNF